jgi:hypothetical protein
MLCMLWCAGPPVNRQFLDTFDTALATNSHTAAALCTGAMAVSFAAAFVSGQVPDGRRRHITNLSVEHSRYIPWTRSDQLVLN